MKKMIIKPGKQMIVNGCIVLALLGVYLYSLSTEGFSWPWFLKCVGLILAIGCVLNLNIRLKKAAGIVWMALLPPLSFYMLESYSHNAFEMSAVLQVLNILFFYMLFALLFFITGSGRVAGVLGCALPMVIGIANDYTVSFRGSPILPWDLLSLGTAVSVSDNYQFTVEYAMLLTALGFVLLMAVASKLDISWPVRSSFKRLAGRCCGALLSVLAVFCIFLGLQTGSFKSFLGLDETLFMPNSLYATNGFAVSFIYNLQYIEVDKPEDYSVDAVAQIMAPYMEDEGEDSVGNSQVQREDEQRNVVGNGSSDTSLTGGSSESRETDETASLQETQESEETVVQIPETGDSLAGETQDSENPNIIVIMNEAFSDLSVLGDFPVNMDYMPFFRSLTENTVRGNLFVSVKGGNTANTEFEFLTGDTMAFLPQGSIAYQQYIHEAKPTLTSWLESMGYATAALHPFNASGWDRDEVYPYFGFDTILFYPDFTYRDTLRTYVSDESSFKQIIDLYENKDEDTPVFIFEVTMQNHGGYYNDYDNFIPEISLEFEPESAKEKHYTEQYLSLIKKTDEAFQMLIEYFSAQDEKTIVVMFGDHQPTDIIAEPIMEYCGTSDDDSLEYEQQRYTTPFVIWANYDIEEKEIERISANYLSGLVLEVAGLEKTGYQEFLYDLFQELPVITANVYIDAEGNYYNSQDNPYAGQLEQYRSLQYYHLFEADKSLSDFYGVTPQ